MKNDEKMIKSTNNPSKEEMSLLREKFVSDYSRKKGWNTDKLSPDQLLEIVSQKEYKNPLIILG